MAEATHILQQEALEPATQGLALAMAKGIPESEIKPRENVFTFHAWKALDRSVKRGEHGVKVVTFIFPNDLFVLFMPPPNRLNFPASLRYPTQESGVHVGDTGPPGTAKGAIR
jgi:hypothetical protein